MDQEGGPSLGVVTECISNVDAQVLQVWRPELARLSVDTGLQIFETEGLSGSNVMVIGPKTILKKVVPVLEQTLRGSDDISCFMELKSAIRTSAGVAPPGLLSPPPGLRFLTAPAGTSELHPETGLTAADQVSFACLNSSPPDCEAIVDCEGSHITSLATSEGGPRTGEGSGSEAPNDDLAAGSSEDFYAIDMVRHHSLDNELDDGGCMVPPPLDLCEADPAGSPKHMYGAKLDKLLPLGPESLFSIHSRAASKETAPSALLSNAFSALSEATSTLYQEPVPVLSASMFQAITAHLSPTMAEDPRGLRNVEETPFEDACAEADAEASNPFGVSDMLSSAISAVLADASSSTDATSQKKKKNKSEKKRQAQQQANACDTFQFSFPKPVALEGVKSRKKIIFRMNQAGFTYPGNKKATVSDVSLEVSQVSRILVTGAKGAGKSTVMKMMIWEQLPTTGTIQKVEGLEVAHFNKDSFAQMDKFTNETPSDYIMRHAALATNPQEEEGEPGCAQEDVDGHLSNFGMNPHAMIGRHIKTLGEADRVKVALAAAMWRRPHVLILDEPSSFLGSEAVEALLLSIKEYKGGVVLFTHTKDKDCFNSLGGEVWNIRGGQLRAADAEPRTPLRKRTDSSKNEECKSSDKKNVVAKDLKEAIQDVERKLKNNTLTEEEGWDIKLKLDELKQMMS